MEHGIVIGGESLPNQNDGLGSGLLSQPQPIDPMDGGPAIGQAQVSEPGIGTTADNIGGPQPPLMLEAVGELQSKGGTSIIVIIGLAALILGGITLITRMALKDGT